MKNRVPLVVGAAIGLGGVLLGLVTGRPSVGQAPAPPPKAVGRFQTVAGGSLPTVVIMDTATGHCWARPAIGGTSWLDMGTPVPSDR